MLFHETAIALKFAETLRVGLSSRLAHLRAAFHRCLWVSHSVLPPPARLPWPPGGFGHVVLLFSLSSYVRECA
jgi:hypothetical protein